MSSDSDVIGIGILGAASIAKKNARAIHLARNNIGVQCVCTEMNKGILLLLIIACLSCIRSRRT